MKGILIRISRNFFVCAAASLFTGCISTQKLKISISSDEAINLNQYGESSPVRLTFIPVKDDSHPDEWTVDYRNEIIDKAKLENPGASVTHTIWPGESKDVELVVSRDASSLGVIGHFSSPDLSKSKTLISIKKSLYRSTVGLFVQNNSLQPFRINLISKDHPKK